MTFHMSGLRIVPIMDEVKGTSGRPCVKGSDEGLMSGLFSAAYGQVVHNPHYQYVVYRAFLWPPPKNWAARGDGTTRLYERIASLPACHV
jgi:hypothetical protein